MEQDNRNRNESVFSRKIRAGRRRTYFFDVKTTRGNEYYLIITESKKRHDGQGYERHKIFLYKEDLNKFIAETTEVVNFIKSKMPDFDFDSYNHVYENSGNEGEHSETDTNAAEETTNEEEPENKQDETPVRHDDDDDLKM
ncbi:MAG: DUF3276 family protein [Chitinophagales bacterium]